MLALVVAAHVVGAAPVISVDGTVHDAIAVGSELWLSASDARGRRLVRIDKNAKAAGGTSSVSADAIFVDACPDGRVVYADAKGLVAANGTRLVEARALFTVPDPTALLAADLCGKDGQGKNELRLPVVDGLLVVAPGASSAVTLKFAHDARAYSGRVHRGLRPDRGYAFALSLYGPRLFDVDVDGDKDTDLVAVRESRVSVWRRGADGKLDVAPAAERDIAKMLGVGDEADLRVRLVDVDGDARVDAVVGVTKGAIPDKSEAWLLSSSSEPFGKASSLWKREGLAAAIGQRGRALVVAELDTSLVSLSGVVLTGRIPVKVALESASASASAMSNASSSASSPLVMQAKVDVRAGRMDGALPVVTVDFDGDGVLDLLDLGEPGSAKLHKATTGGWSLDADATFSVPSFVHVVPMPDLRAVVLIGAARKGKTPVAVVTTSSASSTSARPRANSTATSTNCDPVLDFDCGGR